MNKPPVILGLAQNQWAHKPDRLAEVLAHDPERRHDLIRAFMVFAPTGKRLRAALGPWFHRMTWDNASPQITATASGAPPADLDHVRGLLETVKPGIVVTFGRIAQNAVGAVGWNGPLIAGPHPAARHPDIGKRLRKVRTELDRLAREW